MHKEPEPLELSATKLKELRTQYKQERDRRIAERLQCVWLFAQGYAVKELERILGVGKRTLCKWLTVFRTQSL